MAVRIANPYQATEAKMSSGKSDVYISNGVYKFMGCSISSVNMSLGFNGTSNSLSIVLVEDTKNGDLFIEPDIPSLWAFSLPKGGIGANIFYPDGSILDQAGFYGPNVPFYFAGICTGWTRVVSDVSGRTIQVNIADTKEILNGIQCLLGGFALSQNIGNGAPRYSGIDNIIDVFGYFNYGMESEKNEYGMPWYNIKEALENSRVRVHDIYIEFFFTGEAFTEAPDFYRIEDETIDLVALAQKVATDSGSDLVCISRKINKNKVVVELTAVRRKENLLKAGELNSFISQRSEILESARAGEEFRNEANSNIIIGGFKNTNYLALPSEYIESMHLNPLGLEDYNAFPQDIKVRLFGGKATVYRDPGGGLPLTEIKKDFAVKSGSIFPFWGFTPDDFAYPLIEPFLPLDHLALTYDSRVYGNLHTSLPVVKISVKTFSVRNNPHKDVFFENDGLADDRPFAYISEISTNNDVDGVHKKIYKKELGLIYGLPLNTEVLRAACTTDSYHAFFNIYKLYYPEIAKDLGVPGIQSTDILKIIEQQQSRGEKPDLRNFPIANFLFDRSDIQSEKKILTEIASEQVQKSDQVYRDILTKISAIGEIKTRFLRIIFELVRQYALDYMGKKWIVCLPQSIIMQRIWAGLPVPTRPERPQIEYQVDQKGFWEYVPDELDGVTFDKFGNAEPDDEENQIRRKFMAEDGRFYPMILMRWKPEGNINFNSNGINKAMFQDLSVSDFRPNKIAKFNPDRVFISCSVNQLLKRPDLALVEMSGPVHFDPPDSNLMADYKDNIVNAEFIATKSGVMNYFLYFINKDATLRAAIRRCANDLGIDFNTYRMKVVQRWSEVLSTYMSRPFLRSHSTEKIMDLEAITIPLTSTWLSYGPWYADYNRAKGMVRVEVDQSLVPWNFTTPPEINGLIQNDNKTVMERLDDAGNEKLERTICDLSFLANATVTVAGFPEFGPANNVGNNNLTTISVDFNIGGIKTTYNFSTYAGRPGTYRKSDYDNVSRSRIDTREQLHQPENINILSNIGIGGTNRFRE